MLTKESIKRIAQSVDIKSDYEELYQSLEGREWDEFVEKHVSYIKEILKDVVDRAVYDYISSVFPNYTDPETDPYEKDFVSDVLYELDNSIWNITDVCDELSLRVKSKNKIQQS